MKTALILRKGQVSLSIERMLLFKQRRRVHEFSFPFLIQTFVLAKYRLMYGRK